MEHDDCDQYIQGLVTLLSVDHLSPWSMSAPATGLYTLDTSQHNQWFQHTAAAATMIKHNENWIECK